MDWCRTQSVSIDMDANERAVFHFRIERFYSRVWTVAVIVLGMLYAAWGISNGLAWAFPWLSSLRWIIIGYFCIPCLSVLGVCELIVFSRARPGLHRVICSACSGSPSSPSYRKAGSGEP